MFFLMKCLGEVNSCFIGQRLLLRVSFDIIISVKTSRFLYITGILIYETNWSDIYEKSNTDCSYCMHRSREVGTSDSNIINSHSNASKNRPRTPGKHLHIPHKPLPHDFFFSNCACILIFRNGLLIWNKKIIACTGDNR